MTIFELYGSIGLQDNGFKKGINEATNAGKSFTTSVKGIIGTVAGLKGVQLAFNAVKDSVTAAMNRIDTMEQFNRTMTVLTGSSSAASKAMDQVLESVTGTAYGLTQAASGVQNFVTSGMDLSVATDTVGTFADAVSFYGSGTNDSLEMVLDALNKTYTNGKVYQTNLNSLMLQGIPALQIFADATGDSVEEVQDKFRSGEIGAQEFVATLTNALEEGTAKFPSISGAAQEAGASWKGTFDNMQADVTKATTNIMQDIDKSLVNGGLPSMREGLRMTSKSFASFLEGAGSVFTNLLKVAAPAAKAVSQNIDVLAASTGSALSIYGGYKVIKTFSTTIKASTTAVSAAKVVQTAMNEASAKDIILQGLRVKSVTKGTNAEIVQTIAKKAGLSVDTEGNLVTAKGIILDEAEAAALLKSSTAITGKTLVTSLLSTQIDFATKRQLLWNAAMSANPIGIVITAVGALAGILALSAKELERERAEYNELTESARGLEDALSEVNATYDESVGSAEGAAIAAGVLVDRLALLESQGLDTAAQQSAYAGVVAELNQVMPDLNAEIDQNTGAVKGGTEALKASVKAQRDYLIEQARIQASADSYAEVGEVLYDIETAEKRVAENAKKQATIFEELSEVTGLTTEQMEGFRAGSGTMGDELLRLTGATGDSANEIFRLSDEAYKLAIETDGLTDAIATNEMELAEFGAQAGLTEEEIAAYRAELAVTESQTENVGSTTANMAEIVIANSQSIAEAYDSLTEAQQESLGRLVGAYETMTSSLSNLSEQIVRDDETTWASVKDNQASVIAETQTFSDLYAQLINAGISESYLDAIGATGPESIPLLQGMLNSGIDEVLASQSEWETAYQGIGDSFVDSFKMDDKAKSAIKEYVNGQSGIVGTLQSAIDAADLNGLGNAVGTGFAEGVEDTVPDVEVAGENIGEAAKKGAKAALESNSPSKVFIRIGKDVVLGFKKGLTDNKDDATIATANIIKAASAKAKSEVSAANFSSIGTQMMNGITNGINSGKSGVISAMVSAINSAHSAAKAADDQHSPSKWWKGFALNSMAGWAGGVTAGTDNVVDKIEDAVHQVENAANPSIGFGEYSYAAMSRVSAMPVASAASSAVTENHNAFNIYSPITEELFEQFYDFVNNRMGSRATINFVGR